MLRIMDDAGATSESNGKSYRLLTTTGVKISLKGRNCFQNCWSTCTF